MWVCLNDEGKRVWGDVFPDGKVPVCSMNFHNASLEGAGGKERVILVNWWGLSDVQRDAVLAKLSQRTGAPIVEILQDIMEVGLPLRERYTTGCVAAELRFFV
jgi:predicted Fe-S protein YdhL (DUF1289 family)